MSGFALEIKDKGFDEALAKVDGIDQLDEHELLDGIGRFLQESTRERIEVSKTAPDGSSWPANIGGTSLLYQSGNLAASIDYQIMGSSVFIGSALIYAAIHQMGGTILPIKGKHLVFMIGNALVFATKVEMPARPYLGISSDDKTGILEAAEDMIGRSFQ